MFPPKIRFPDGFQHSLSHITHELAQTLVHRGETPPMEQEQREEAAGQDGGLPSEQEQIEEAIRESLRSEEQHHGDGPEHDAPASSSARKGRSGLRIKLRGAS